MPPSFSSLSTQWPGARAEREKRALVTQPFVLASPAHAPSYTSFHIHHGLPALVSFTSQVLDQMGTKLLARPGALLPCATLRTQVCACAWRLGCSVGLAVVGSSAVAVAVHVMEVAWSMQSLCLWGRWQLVGPHQLHDVPTCHMEVHRFT